MSIPLRLRTTRGLTSLREKKHENQTQFITEQMGIVQRNSALSVNRKERLDFSCAIFDSASSLILLTFFSIIALEHEKLLILSRAK